MAYKDPNAPIFPDMGLLAVPFAPADVSFKPGSVTRDKTKGMAMAYVDARALQNRLDAVCGPARWSATYASGPAGGVVCTLSVLVHLKDGTERWVAKQDGAENSQVEAVKGGISGAFKRACVQFGMGRDLYAEPSRWVRLDERGRFAETPTLSPAYMEKLKAARTAAAKRMQEAGLVEPEPDAPRPEAPEDAHQDALPAPAAEDTRERARAPQRPTQRTAAPRQDQRRTEAPAAEAQDAPELLDYQAELLQAGFDAGLNTHGWKSLLAPLGFSGPPAVAVSQLARHRAKDVLALVRSPEKVTGANANGYLEAMAARVERLRLAGLHSESHPEDTREAMLAAVEAAGAYARTTWTQAPELLALILDGLERMQARLQPEPEAQQLALDAPEPAATEAPTQVRALRRVELPQDAPEPEPEPTPEAPTELAPAAPEPAPEPDTTEPGA